MAPQPQQDWRIIFVSWSGRSEVDSFFRGTAAEARAEVARLNERWALAWGNRPFRAEPLP